MIEVSLEPNDFRSFVAENCCLCGNPTRYWYVPKDVACCQLCAKKACPDDVPDKTTWISNCRKQKGITQPPTVGDALRAMNIRALLTSLKELDQESRLEIFRQFCNHCGSNDPRCQCWNDD